MPALLLQVMNRLDGVDAEVKSFFAPVARLVLSSRDPQDALEVRGVLLLCTSGRCDVWVLSGSVRLQKRQSADRLVLAVVL